MLTPNQSLSSSQPPLHQIGGNPCKSSLRIGLMVPVSLNILVPVPGRKLEKHEEAFVERERSWAEARFLLPPRLSLPLSQAL